MVSQHTLATQVVLRHIQKTKGIHQKKKGEEKQKSENKGNSLFNTPYNIFTIQIQFWYLSLYVWEKKKSGIHRTTSLPLRYNSDTCPYMCPCNVLICVLATPLYVSLQRPYMCVLARYSIFFTTATPTTPTTPLDAYNTRYMNTPYTHTHTHTHTHSYAYECVCTYVLHMYIYTQISHSVLLRMVCCVCDVY